MCHQYITCILTSDIPFTRKTHMAVVKVLLYKSVLYCLMSFTSHEQINPEPQISVTRNTFINKLDISSDPITDFHINKKDKAKYTGCHDIRSGGYRTSGIYRVWLNASINYHVFCHFDDNDISILIQQRKYGNISFNRDWKDYVSGFGDATGDYWAGLKQIYYLTSSGNTILHVYLHAWTGEKKTISYGHFELADESLDYLMYVGNPYAGDLKDDLSYHSGMKFATYDHPDQHRCAKLYQAGWWYNQCAKTLLNGKYYHGGKYQPTSKSYDGIFWNDWMGQNYSMKFTSMYVSTTLKQPKFPTELMEDG